jgi:hypothetical protein
MTVLRRVVTVPNVRAEQPRTSTVPVQSVCTHTSAVVSETCRRTGPSKSVTEPPYEREPS